MRQLTLDMRSSLLDIEGAPDRRAAATTTVIRVQIQPRNSFRRSQQYRQLQLCVPLVVFTGEYDKTGGFNTRPRPPCDMSSLWVGRELAVRVDLTDRNRVAVDWMKSGGG